MDALPDGAVYDGALRQRHKRALQAICRGEAETYEERLDLLAHVVWPDRVERRAA